MSIGRTAVTLAAALAAAAAPAAAVTPVHGGGRHLSVMADCEDANIQPCITYDEGQWRRVDSYRPYTAHRVRTCKAASGAGTLPCVWPHRRADGGFSYYWRRRF